MQTSFRVSVPAKDPVAKLVVDPDVDEEVGEVVDVRNKVHVSWEYAAREHDDHGWQKSGDRHAKQTRSDSQGLRVTCSRNMTTERISNLLKNASN